MVHNGEGHQVVCDVGDQVYGQVVLHTPGAGWVQADMHVQLADVRVYADRDLSTKPKLLHNPVETRSMDHRQTARASGRRLARASKGPRTQQRLEPKWL